MNSEKYIKAVDEIKADESLKLKAINNTKVKHKPKIVYKLANATLAVLLIFSLIWLINEDNSRRTINTNPVESLKINLPTIQSYEKLSKYIKDNENITTLSTDRLESQMLNDSFSAKEESKNYSETNVQVEGIDEADIVKTDGKYIYYIAQNKLVIVDTTNPNNIVLINEIKFDNNFMAYELYIKNNRLILLGSISEENDMSRYYMYDVLYMNSKTKAIIYDISRIDNIKVIREIEINGDYISSRMIDNNVYIVADKPLYSSMEETEAKPKYKDTVVSDDYIEIPYEKIYYFPESKENNYLYIAAFNISINKEVNVQTFLGGGNTIYVGNNNLYVANTIYDSDWSNNKTEIYKFTLQSDRIAYNAKSTVNGTLLNQFSMDEYNGNFRVAVTEGQNWEDDVTSNNLYVLDENLNTIGKLEGLAEGERIKSVRFMGEKVYIVTFKNVDPLFVIDLSEPTNPKVLGELKIPGYSEYLHPYDENHIIGFGYDAETVNKYGSEMVITTGMKMALFDVSDVTNPKEMYTVKIGDGGTYSEIIYNHKALLFSKEKNIIAFPIYVTEDESNTRTNLTFQGAIIYGLDLNDGFTLKGRISHMEIDEGYDDYEYNKAVDRIIYINDTLYTLSKGLIKATDMNTFEEQSYIEIKTEQENIIVN